MGRETCFSEQHLVQNSVEEDVAVFYYKELH